MTVRIHAIVLAGGDGNRFGGELPKQLVRLAGEPILARTLRCLQGASLDRVVVVAHPAWLEGHASAGRGDGRRRCPSRWSRAGRRATRAPATGSRRWAPRTTTSCWSTTRCRPLLPADVVRRAIEPIIAGRAEATEP